MWTKHWNVRKYIVLQFIVIYDENTFQYSILQQECDIQWLAVIFS